MQPGDKVRLVCNPAILLTVKRVSPHVEMIEVEECAGWGWAYGYVPADMGKVFIPEWGPPHENIVQLSPDDLEKLGSIWKERIMETFEQWWDRVGSHNDVDASGSTARQAWHAALKQIRNDAVNREEALSDWEKTRRGEISFKIFADKWLPYLPLGESTI